MMGKFRANKPLSRRSFLKTTLGTSAGIVAGGAFAQAWYAKSPELLGSSRGNRVVIIGGGWGGITAARHLLRDERDVEVVLIEQKPFFMSCPMSNLYLVGLASLDFLTFDYSNAIAEGLVFINERAMEIDRDAKTVATSSGNITYDYLVVSPGVDYDYDAIEGYSEVSHLLPVGFKPFEHLALRKQLETFEGGTFLLSIPRPPYRCPPGPYERAALLGWYVKERGLNAKVVVLDANNEPITKTQGFLDALEGRHGDVLEYYPNAEVTKLDYENRIVNSTFGEFEFDSANIIPPMKGGEIVQTTELGERWASVEPTSFLSQADSSVYVIGDAAGDTPFPKSGTAANGEGHIVAGHILERLAGKSPGEIAVRLPGSVCYSFVAEDRAIWVSANYSYNEASGEITRELVSDQEASAESATTAFGWAQSMWQDMFG